MQLAAEGLTGRDGDFFVLPRKCFVFHPASQSTTMFRIQRGFNIQKLSAMEQVLVRLASFATNTHGAASLPSRFPTDQELRNALKYGSVKENSTSSLTQRQMAQEILDLASRAEGFYYFINSDTRPDSSIQHPHAQSLPITQEAPVSALREQMMVMLTFSMKKLLAHPQTSRMTIPFPVISMALHFW